MRIRNLTTRLFVSIALGALAGGLSQMFLGWWGVGFAAAISAAAMVYFDPQS